MNTSHGNDARPRILIVDDERININILNSLLKTDYRIMAATGGEQAIKAAVDGQPDLILLDILMPGMDGHLVCRKLKSNPATRAIPIIFITAMGDVENETMGFALGAVDYISKPFNNAVVKARVGVHLRLKRQNDMLESLASMDPLTSVPNRRAYDQAREEEWRRCQREKQPISFIMIDVDHFKPYNDNYGHGAGDECLVRIAKAIDNCIHRPGDMLARYGGEEFAAIMSGTHSVGARQMAQQFHAAVAELAISHAHSSVAPHVTLSVGVATTVPTDEVTPEQLSEAADKMLYQAKESGRNMTCVIEI
ncbi:MAG TPA: diguanylate cyclase [Gallionella sp.]|nr:diguanylate cyclase [Gallionella sp.]